MDRVNADERLSATLRPECSVSETGSARSRYNLLSTVKSDKIESITGRLEWKRKSNALRVYTAVFHVREQWNKLKGQCNEYRKYYVHRDSNGEERNRKIRARERRDFRAI